MDIDYTNYYRDSEYKNNENLFKNIFQKRFNIISKFVNNPERVLDIGCSNGIFLDLYKGSKTWGVEPSENARLAQNKKHKVLNLNFENAKLPENYFDLVIMNHTLEHVKDADIVLTKVHKILKKDGILFIDVPNAGGLGSIIMGSRWPYRLIKEHTYQFTKGSLSKIIIDNKFRILHWESRSGLFEFANPFLELCQSFTQLKKRFFTNIFYLPYSSLATIINMGDSMSFVVKKV